MLIKLDDISQLYRVLATQTLDDPNILVGSSYFEEISQHELLQLNANWGKESERVSDKENYDNDDDDVGGDDHMVRSDDNNEYDNNDIFQNM